MDTLFDGQAPAPAPAAGEIRGRVALLCQEDILGHAIETTLRRDGADLTRADCRIEALDRLRAMAPDMIIIEARHTDPDAFGLCQTIRQTHALDRSKLLLLQDTGRPIDHRRATALGADGFLSMPFGMAELRREVGRLLEA